MAKKSGNDIKQAQLLNTHINMIYFFVMLGLCVMRICGNYGVFSFLGKQANYYLNLFSQIFLILLLPLFLIKLLSGSKPKEISQFCCYKKVSGKIVIACIVLGVVVFFLNVYVSSIFNSLIALFGYKHKAGTAMNPTWWNLVMSLIGTAVLPAICEETLNRGLFMNGNFMKGMKKSILLSGFMFGLLHLNIEQFFYASIIGFFLGYLCWGCGSIWPCIIIHFTNNAMSVFFSFASAKGWAIGNLFQGIANYVNDTKVFGVVMFILLLALLVYIGYQLVKFLFKETFKQNFAIRQKDLASMAIREAYLKSIENINDGESSQDAVQETKFLTEKEFLSFVNENLETIIKTSVIKEAKEDNFKPSRTAQIFLWGTIALGAIVTLMTFIWGVL